MIDPAWVPENSNPDETDDPSLAEEVRLRREKVQSALNEIAREQNPVEIAKDALGTEWMLEGNCVDMVQNQGYDPDIWFDAPVNSFQARDATNACFSCPVRLQCLKWSTVAREYGGIWGGVSANVRHNRRAEYGAFNYDALSQLENPYETDNTNSAYHEVRLKDWINPRLKEKKDKE
jgi:hypothetical protein